MNKQLFKLPYPTGKDIISGVKTVKQGVASGMKTAKNVARSIRKAEDDFNKWGLITDDKEGNTILTPEGKKASDYLKKNVGEKVYNYLNKRKKNKKKK